MSKQTSQSTTLTEGARLSLPFKVVVAAIISISATAWAGSAVYTNLQSSISQTEQRIMAIEETDKDQDGKIDNLENSLSEIKGNTKAILQLLRRNR